MKGGLYPLFFVILDRKDPYFGLTLFKLFSLSLHRDGGWLGIWRFRFILLRQSTSPPLFTERYKIKKWFYLGPLKFRFCLADKIPR